MAAAKRDEVVDEIDSTTSGEVDLAITNAIFILLLEAPELVTAKKGNAELHYAKRRNAELMDEVDQLKQARSEIEEELKSRMTRLELKEIEDMKKLKRTERKKKNAEQELRTWSKTVFKYHPSSHRLPPTSRRRRQRH